MLAFALTLGKGVAGGAYTKQTGHRRQGWSRRRWQQNLHLHKRFKCTFFNNYHLVRRREEVRMLMRQVKNEV